MKKRLFCLLLSLLLLLSFVSCKTETDESILEMRFLDVGQGDATLLRTSVGDVLIDAGPESEQDLLCLRLQNLGVETLTLAIFTHADEDHIGGADGVLRQFPTETVWISPFFEENEASLMLRSAAEETGAEIVEVAAGISRVFGETVLSVFSPYGTMKGMDDNEKSLVIRLVCGEISAMLMGDAGERTEKLLLDEYPQVQLDCDLLKVAHHGASNVGGQRFLNVLTPDHAVISCEEGNSYGHPHGETLARLEAVDAEIYRTDLLGDVAFYSDGNELWLKN